MAYGQLIGRLMIVLVVTGSVATRARATNCDTAQTQCTTGSFTISSNLVLDEAPCDIHCGSNAVTITGQLSQGIAGAGINITAGSLTVSGGKILTTSSSTPGGAININLTSASGGLTLINSGTEINSSASRGGGEITVSSGTGGITITRGSILADGGTTGICGSGGNIELTTTGAFLLSNTSTQNKVSSTASHDSGCGGGGITISASSVQIDRLIDGHGGSPGGATIAATGGSVTVGTDGELKFAGGDDNDGGDVAITATGAITLNGPISVKGSSGFAGGAVSAAATTSLSVGAAGDIDASGIEGGSIDLSSRIGSTGVTVASGAVLNADGDEGGGSIDVQGRGAGSIVGSLHARGGSGIIRVTHCSLDISGDLDTTGSFVPGGFNIVSANSLTIQSSADILAPECGTPSCPETAPPCGNVVILPNGTSTPSGGTVSPAWTREDLDDPTICCGNGASNPGEACDPGNLNLCDSCLSDCTQPAGGPCPADANECDIESCDSSLGCIHTPVDCGGDGIACTLECDPDEGCLETPILEHSLCDDDNPCSSDTCSETGCVHDDAEDGEPCDDGDVCSNGLDTCQGGECVGNSLLCCDDENDCTVDSCDPDIGCLHKETASAECPASCTGLSDDHPCTDNSPFSQADHCEGGACVSGSAITCPNLDGNACTLEIRIFDFSRALVRCTTAIRTNCAASCACREGQGCGQQNVCETGTCEDDQCSELEPVDCDDGNAANGQEYCVPGFNGAPGCQASFPRANCGWICGNGVIDPGETCDDGNTSGSDCCGADCQPANNGATCPGDGNACTQTDTCQGGVCTGSNPVVCTPLDQCHLAGTCNPANGTCSNPSKDNGSSCTDGNACTQTDTCQSGVCTGSNPVVCTALSQCHNVGTCAPETGICSNPPKTNGTACNDDKVCTANDACSNGDCTGTCQVNGPCGPGCSDSMKCFNDSGVCTCRAP